jgi:hypothetical protein
LSVTYGRSVVSLGTPVFFPNTTDHHDITKILLKTTLTCPSIYGFWLPFWYLQTFLIRNHSNKKLWTYLFLYYKKKFYKYLLHIFHPFYQITMTIYISTKHALLYWAIMILHNYTIYVYNSIKHLDFIKNRYMDLYKIFIIKKKVTFLSKE